MSDYRRALEPLLDTHWKAIIDGLVCGMEFTGKTVFDDGESKQEDPDSFLSDIDIILWKKLLSLNQVEDYQNRYGMFCVGNPRMEDDKIKLDIVSPPEDSSDDEPQEGMFFCRMKDSRYGFFNARNGSCGYNDCSVGGSYATFSVGTYDSVVKYGMDNEARRWHARLYDCKTL